MPSGYRAGAELWITVIVSSVATSYGFLGPRAELHQDYYRFS